MYNYNFYATGTIWEIEVIDSIHESDFAYIKEQVLLIISDFEQKYSRFVKSSFISKLSRETGEIEIPTDFVDILKIYFDFYELSKGKFTPLIGQMLEDAGYDIDSSFEPKPIRDILKLHDVVTILEPNKIFIKQHATWDFGGVGKGYLMNLVVQLMKESGLKEFSVYAGGDVCSVSSAGNLCKVGLVNPFDQNEAIGVIEVENKAVFSSSVSRKNWAGYNHIIDPVHKKSPVGIATIWIVSESASIADAVATCAFLVDPATLLKKYSFEYMILGNDMSIKKSPGFNADLFLQKKITV